MPPRHIRGIVGAGLLCAAMAGCASTSSDTVYAAKTMVPGTTASAAAAPAATVGCGSVNTATMVTVRRTIRPVEPVVRTAGLVMTQRKPALVRALFSDFCKVVAHPYAPKTPVRCPAAFGIGYTGTFYDGSRVLASFVYGASGCQSVNVTAAGKSRQSLLMGPAASAAPHLETDMAAVLGVPKTVVYGPPQQINPGGPNKPLR
jgi:hypothetical protein